MKKQIRNLLARLIRKLIDSLHDDPHFDPGTLPATKLAMSSLHYAWQNAARRGDPLPPNLGGGRGFIRNLKRTVSCSIWMPCWR